MTSDRSFWGGGTPLIGHSLANYGRIGQLFSTGCTPSAEIWVEAFWYGAAKAFWTAAKPTALGKHGGPQSLFEFGVHRRTAAPKTGKSNPFGIANIGELMPGRSLPVPPGKAWALFEMPIALIRRAGWYLLIFDSISEGLYKWASVAYTFNGCPVEGVPNAYERWPEFHIAITPGLRGPAIGYNLVANSDLVVAGNGIVVPAGYTFTVAAAAVGKSLSDPPKNVSVEIQVDGIGGLNGQATSTSMPNTDGGTTGARIWRRQQTGAHAVGLEFYFAGFPQDLIDVQGSSVYVQASPTGILPPFLTPDP